MSDSRADADWSTASWEGARRLHLRRSLRLTVRERLEALEDLAETSRFFARLRAEGKLRHRHQATERLDTSTAPGVGSESPIR